MIRSVKQLIQFLGNLNRDEKKCICYQLKISDQDADHIAKLLSYDFSLLEFTLLECHLTDACAEKLANALSGNSTLKKLMIIDCLTITEKGALEFAGCVNTCSKLEVLALNNLGITDIYLKNITLMLARNSVLRELHLANNAINTLESIQKLLKSNHTLVTVNVANNPLLVGSSNQLVALQNKNQLFRNTFRYHELQFPRELYQRYNHLICNAIAVPFTKLKIEFAQFGLNTIPYELEQQLITRIYWLQVASQVLHKKTGFMIPLFIVTHLLPFLSMDKPPKSYTNALSRLNQQRQTVIHEGDQTAIINIQAARKRLSLFPLNAEQVQPSRFWWIIHKTTQLAEMLVMNEDASDDNLKREGLFSK